MDYEQLNVRVPAGIAAKIDRVAEDEQRTRSNTVRRLLSEALDRHEPEKVS